MPHDRDDLSPVVGTHAPTAADFDQAFSAAAASAGIRRVWELAEPGLPPQIEPFSFVWVGLLRHVTQALGLSPGQTLVDLGCGPLPLLLPTRHQITIYGLSTKAEHKFGGLNLCSPAISGVFSRHNLSVLTTAGHEPCGSDR